MTSLTWRLILLPRCSAARWAIGVVVVSLPVLLSTFRWREPWFNYVAVAYPAFALTLLLLLFHIDNQVREILRMSGQLFEPSTRATPSSERAPRSQLRWRALSALFVGGALAALSLQVNANPHASRWADTIAVAYLGFLAGEVVVLLAAVPLHFRRLLSARAQLRLNPFDAANTAEMRALADLSLSLGVAVACAVFFMNTVFAFAAYRFLHLFAGVALVSLAGWLSVAGLAVYPHIVLWRLVRGAQVESLRTLDAQLLVLFQGLRDGCVEPQRLELVLKHHQGIASGRTSPMLSSAIFGVLSALALNVLPTVVGWFPVATALRKYLGLP